MKAKHHRLLALGDGFDLKWTLTGLSRGLHDRPHSGDGIQPRVKRSGKIGTCFAASAEWVVSHRSKTAKPVKRSGVLAGWAAEQSSASSAVFLNRHTINRKDTEDAEDQHTMTPCLAKDMCAGSLPQVVKFNWSKISKVLLWQYKL